MIRKTEKQFLQKIFELFEDFGFLRISFTYLELNFNVLN